MVAKEAVGGKKTLYGYPETTSDAFTSGQLRLRATKIAERASPTAARVATLVELNQVHNA